MHAPLTIQDGAVPFPLFNVNDCIDIKCKRGGNFSLLDTSSLNNDTSTHFNSLKNESDPLQLLKKLKISNLNRLVIGHLNINSLRNKFESLKLLIKGNIDILVLTESKLDNTFPLQQFAIEGYSMPFRLDNSATSGGVIIYVREDIPSRELTSHTAIDNFEGIFLEINLRKTKWLIFGGYNHNKSNINIFLGKLGPTLDHYMYKFDNFLLLGDFNSEINESSMAEFCDVYNVKNLITEPTCFKNPLNPSSIDVLLTNKFRSFQNSQTIETGISDHHKLVVTVLKSFYRKQEPITVTYRDYKSFDKSKFHTDLEVKLDSMPIHKNNYELFENTFMNLLNKHAPMKTKYVRANNAQFMNKTLSKAIMTRSRLRNKFLKNPNEMNKRTYNKQRNYCVNLLRKEKKNYFNNIDLKRITDNKQFWKTIKPFFSDKHNISRKITLIEDDEIISNDIKVAETMNDFFINSVKKLNINGYHTALNPNMGSDDILNIVNKFKNHPSILKIKENVNIKEKFSFINCSVADIESEIHKLNTNKPTTFNNIPAKILAENSDICSPFVSKFYNESILKSNFPVPLKKADITPVHKKGDTSIKENYRPVSILPSISKIFERKMHDQISLYIDKHLSNYLCGFRKGYSTQYCLIAMLEKWKKAMDSNKNAGALLTDLSKAFDCLNHELLIAKLEAYGFDHLALAYIFSYLSCRKQRTKLNNYFSNWSDITSGIPQGSIIGPLLFNIYINDIFFIVNDNNLCNYADDNTPYAIDYNIGDIINKLVNDTSLLTKWFNDNYFKMNPDKCHLLITKHEDNLSANIDGHTIASSKSVKLLGVQIDNNLDFNEHVSNICKNVSKKIHALRRVSQYMSKSKLRIIMKAFIESQFGYCPLVWMFHSRTINNRINALHEKALRLVYNDSTLSFEELLSLDESFTIHDRNLQKLATEMFKIKNNLSPIFMNNVFPVSTNPYNLRNAPEFDTSNVHTVHNGTETISFRGPKTWSLVPQEIKNSKSIIEFKNKIRYWKPVGCMCRLCKTFIYNLGFI